MMHWTHWTAIEKTFIYMFWYQDLLGDNMKKEFITVNKIIFDYKQYIKEVEWLKWEIKKRIIALLEKDFMLLEKFEERYDSLHLVFYNKRLDLRLNVECIKKTKEEFI